MTHEPTETTTARRPKTRAEKAHAPAAPQLVPLLPSHQEERDAERPTDEELIKRIQEHDPRALEELYRRHHQILQAVVKRILHSDSDAQDLLQSIFVAIWAGGSLQYKPAKGQPLGWMITMARRRSIDMVRKQVSYVRMCEGYQAEALYHPGYVSGSLEQEIESAEYRRLILAAMQHLPEAQRIAIGLAFFGGLSQRAISARLGTPVGTIKTRITLALLKVRRHLAGVSHELETFFGRAAAPALTNSRPVVTPLLP